MAEKLRKLAYGAEMFDLANAESFSSFARKYGIPLVRFSKKMVRVREADLEAAIERHLERPHSSDDSN